jgi:hypothetical protein
MATWKLLMDAAGWLAAVVAAMLLRWSAIERARIRRGWLRLHRELDAKGAPFTWCVATTVVAGYV